jgi:hypothetical protein
VFPFAPTRTLSIFVLSAESVYVMEGVHWLGIRLVYGVFRTRVCSETHSRAMRFMYSTASLSCVVEMSGQVVLFSSLATSKSNIMEKDSQSGHLLSDCLDPNLE